MAAPALVEADIELGRQIFQALEKDSLLRPRAVLWMYHDEAREWRLVIATEDVKRRGPQAAYLRVRNVLKHTGIENVPLNRLVVASPDNPLLQTIGNVIRTGDESPHGLAFYECVFGNLSVSGMYVYHLQIGATASRARRHASSEAATAGPAA